jgi:hypothetical protein
MLELSWRGAHEIPLADGESRKFLKDGDAARLNSCWIILTFGMVQAFKTPPENPQKTLYR